MENNNKKALPLSKKEVIKAIERKNPSKIPGWYNWVADETWEKYGEKLRKLLDNYSNDILMVDYNMPEGFIEPAPGRDEFYIYYVNKPGVLDHDGGGYIAGPSNSIMPDTPFENIEKMLFSMMKYSDRGLLGHLSE